jgi:ABC-type dipeptide/oligopeptide/nickel transport system permease component
VGTGDLGHSLRSGRPVAAEVADRLPYTIELTLVAVALAVVAGVALGAMAATRPRGWAGRALGPAGAVLLASPVFAIALPLTWLLALRWNVLPVAGADTWRHLVLPAVTLALPSAAAVAQLSRATVAETLSADFVRTARAKGLPWAPLYLRHVFPNAAAPVLAFLGVHLGSLLGGAVVVETIFGWPGLGRLAVQAILSRDLPLAQGTVLALSAGFVLANTAADLTHRALDPRGAV